MAFYRKGTSLKSKIDEVNEAIKLQLRLLTSYVNPKRGPVEVTASSNIRFDDVIDYLDDICENIGMSLDKAKNRGSGEMVISDKKRGPAPDMTSQDVISREDDSKKPQLYFDQRPDNSEPLDEQISKARANPEAYFAKLENKDEFMFEHPYLTEIRALQPLPKMMELQVTPVHPGKETPQGVTFVDTVSNLMKMIEVLKTVDEIAVDLEHHEYRSFLGMTCLVQISTRSHDYLVDAIALRSHLKVLNQVFSNPAILKVFHGANMDVQWLQRDFGVYVVNLFDTHKAIVFLNKPPFNFASLLFRYANEVTDKDFQLADWRVRPLTPDMEKYARRDTHYLLYIYDSLRRDVIEEAKAAEQSPEANLLKVFEASKEVSLIQYHKPATFRRDFYSLYDNQSNIWGDDRMSLFKELWVWRNRRAREDDESESYIMTKSLLMELVSSLPTTKEAVFKLKKRLSKATIRYLDEICRIIARTEAKIRHEEEDPANLPARVSASNLNRRGHKAHPATELKAELGMAQLVIELKDMSVHIGNPGKQPVQKKKEKHASEVASAKFGSSLFARAVQSSTSKSSLSTTSSIKSSFIYNSPLDLLREIYPDLDIQPPKKTSGLLSSQETGQMSSQQTAEQTETLDYIGLGDGKKRVVEDLKEMDVIDRLSSINLPKSLQDKFKVNLLKIKKKDLNNKTVEIKKHQNKTNELQSTSRDIFSKGNVFEALQRSKVEDEDEEEEDGSLISLTLEEEEKKPDFWKQLNDMKEKQEQQKMPKPRKDFGKRVGEFGIHNGNKKRNDKKKGKFSQPTNKSTIKF